MPSRHELNLRARAVGFDPATIANDSKLEQKVLYLEKNATTFSGTGGSQTLTVTDTFSNNETITIGGQVYTMKTALSSATAANEVLIGASAAASLDNLKAAINGDAGGGTTYGSATPVNEKVTATTNTDTTQVVAARDTNVTNASVGTTETATNASWGAATLAGGAAAIVAEPSAGAAGVKATAAGMSGDENVSV